MTVPASHLVLHALAVRKHGGADDIAVICDLDDATVSEQLKAAVDSGRAVEQGGRYALTPAAHMALRGAYARHYAALRADNAFLEASAQFERVNTELKALITRWQTMTVAGQTVPNDHSDPDYDEAVIDDLGALHERAETVLRGLAAGVPRLDRYRERLDAALQQAEDGAHEWVSDARRDSYHTVWFELHEDLLRLLGREREETV